MDFHAAPLFQMVSNSSKLSRNMNTTTLCYRWFFLISASWPLLKPYYGLIVCNDGSRVAG